MGVIAIDVNLPAEDDAETYADFADRRQCLARGETADLTEAPCTLDIGCVEKREDLITAGLDNRRVGNAHAGAFTNARLRTNCRPWSRALQIRPAGQRFIAAPVSGRPDVAAAGKLYVITAGEPDAIAAAGNLFNAIGQQIFNGSETRKAANLVKLSGNFLIASVIESVGEALALVSRKRR
jgi:hypothetical protein